VRTVSNMVEALGEEFEFRVVTSDRDFGSLGSYSGVEPGRWVPVGKAWVWYAPPENQGIRDWLRLMGETPHDFLYFNSLFDPRFTLLPLLGCRLFRRRVPIVLAPGGELSPGALGLKHFKKSLFLLLAKPLGFYRGIVWRASSEDEEHLIRLHFGSDAPVLVARNIPAHLSGNCGQGGVPHGDSHLRIAFLSRISRMKNLGFALEVLGSLSAPAVFDIWGTREDNAYWRECQKLITSLPANIKVSYRGEAHPNRVVEILAGYDLLFLPTLGENYGHVIAESLAAGTPVLISDQTPWRGLAEEGIGWDLSLGDKAAFVRAILDMSSMSAQDRGAQRERVREYARKVLNDPEVIEANRRLFLLAATSPHLKTSQTKQTR